LSHTPSTLFPYTTLFRSDINMPAMNGIELCQKLRCIPHHKKTPVIFVTLCGDFESRAQSLLSGGDDLISKPIAPVELIVKATILDRKSTRLNSSHVSISY